MFKLSQSVFLKNLVEEIYMARLKRSELLFSDNRGTKLQSDKLGNSNTNFFETLPKHSAMPSAQTGILQPTEFLKLR